MKTIRKLTALLAIGTLVLLTGCAGHSVKGDLPESMQTHLQAHPGDIRFNRPKIVWKVDWDEGRHVLPEEVYLQLYKDLLNRVWDDAGLDQGSGKAYDVTVEVPLYFDYPGGHWVADYLNGYTGYWITVTDPQTGQVVGEWGNPGSNDPYSNSNAHWRAGSPDAPTCNELGHWYALPMAGLVTAAPLVAVKSGQAASLEDGIRQELQSGIFRMTGKYDGIGVGGYNRFNEMLARHPRAYRALLKDIGGICPIGVFCYGGVHLRTTTMAETKAAAEKVGYPIQFGPECKDYVY